MKTISDQLYGYSYELEVGSQIIQAASSAAPDVYTKFPSSWEQTGGTFS